MIASTVTFVITMFIPGLAAVQGFTCLPFSGTAALTDEQKEYQNLARKFAKEVIMPQSMELDRTGEVTSVL